MLELVTIADARHQLRLDADSEGGPDDGWLEIFIPAISAAVASWLKDPARLYLPEVDSEGDIVRDSEGDPIPKLDSAGDPIVHPIVRAAVLIEIASQFRFREGDGKDVAVPAHEGHGYTLTRAATALLTGMRRSTVA